jgi:hypothetical protein
MGAAINRLVSYVESYSCFKLAILYRENYTVDYADFLGSYRDAGAVASICPAPFFISRAV